jgi:hypothetical protein
MSRRAATRAARAQLAWVLAAVPAGLVFWQLGSGIPLALVPFVVLALAASGVAALVVARRPENSVGWILAVQGTTAGLALAAGGYVDWRLSAGDDDAATQAATWLAGVAEPVAFTIVVPFLFLFPDGRLPSGRWGRVAIPSIAAVVISLVATAFAPWPLTSYSSGAAVPPDLENPLALPGAAGDVLDAIQTIAFVAVLVSFPLAAASLVHRYRAAASREREQIKWIAYAGGLVVLAILAGQVLHASDASNWSDEGSVAVLLCMTAIATLPVAAGVAILQYRLYDIDRIISRTLVYGALTVILGAAYAGLVLAGQAVFSSFAGGSDLAIAGSTLVVAALFLPLRSRVHRFVDRRFYRGRYDARRTLDAFGARLREQTDLQTLQADLREVVHETMRPAHASLWLRSGGGS